MNSEEIFFKNQSNIRFLLITANTGTIFEKPELLTAWVTEFANLLRQHPSDFIALHCQEVGGKDYERFMHILDPFIKDILRIPEVTNHYTRSRFYFDTDYTSQDTFTALGSAYFVRENIPIQQWNFTTSCFENVTQRQIFTGNLVQTQTVRKKKFPREFFSEAKWSRKGFTQARWSINNFIFDMVNVHLFHDASNIVAVEQSPSIYSNFRKNALEFTLKSLPLNSSDESVPYVIFGDFNFRLNGHRLLEHMVEKRDGSIDKIKHSDTDEISKIIIKNSQNKTKLTIGKKEFNLHDDHDSFFSTDSRQFHMFDDELSSFADQLFEYEKSFPPSYPYSEELEEAHSYLPVRCPAWCDRILLSYPFKKMINTEINQITYSVLGEDVCMGDHKPVYLALTVHLLQGWSTFSSSLNTNFYSCETAAITSNHNNDNNNNNNNNNNNHNNDTSNQAKLHVTAVRKRDLNTASDLILNGVQLLSNDIDFYNIHDYAMFVQPALLPQWWFNKLQQRSIKTINNSSKLWAKVRAVTYMTSLGHRTGSWYSDDQTEKSPIDDISLSDDNDDKNNKTNIQLNDLHDYHKTDIVIPLRRSFSSNAYVQHNEMYSTTLARSCSTTLINSSDHLSDSSPIESSSAPPPSLSSLPSPPTLPSSTSPSRSSSRVYRFLHCTNDAIDRLQSLRFANNLLELSASQTMNDKFQQRQSSLKTIYHAKMEDQHSNNRIETVISNDNNDDHRTVIVHHTFHANIKQTFTRRIRETPV
ncbi:unnamed protein product [Rotaria socialis]|uniref:inositol-polyphosphate 5-phosphatase n=1 Tax=Rotaria socialis TaxID=392032 RepID=A0A818NKL6_9BILA|nr:unnamed protein product [Rotaria socialis]CAF3608541.1 unnamed protein product [Rotaria socialis]CAF4504756.1 unnamed protein product [Rotaria socialis]CAF4590339.1 unnamed protein product [Rotaria socialis]